MSGSVRESRCPAYYALIVFTILTSVNQLHRYLLIATIEPMSNDLQFGDKECIVDNATEVQAVIEDIGLNVTDEEFCAADSGVRCINQTSFNNVTLCRWYYTGTGLEFEILAGPVFIIVLGLLGVPVTILAEVGNINRKNVVGVITFLWSVTILCTGFAHTLVEVTVWRFMLGFFQAPFNPFSISILVSFFPPTQRGLAIGLASSGSYAGYGLSYAFIALVELIGWRWSYISAGIGGAVLGILTLLTVKNPPATNDVTLPGSFKDIWKALTPQPWIVLLPIFLAFACKMGYQYTLSYNLNNYFGEYYPTFQTDVILSWMLPVAGIASYMMGGFLSDLVGRRFGARGRLWVIVILEIFQIPLYILFLILDLPFNLITGGLSIIAGDGWLGIGLSAMAEIVSQNIRTVVYALFFCVMDVLGGSVMVAITPITEAIGFRGALLWFGTGMVVGGTLMILLAILALTIKQRRGGIDPEEPLRVHQESERSPLIDKETTSLS
ncbi:MFS-type efflux pump MSMEG_3705-like [Diadema setosum]|uniref:MFS-type efflux pump MSMEG_3705-like n=1 Tax=Diadema setosum TaxID=31175 RepID=UPI003B3A9F00